MINQVPVAFKADYDSGFDMFKNEGARSLQALDKIVKLALVVAKAGSE